MSEIWRETRRNMGRQIRVILAIALWPAVRVHDWATGCTPPARFRDGVRRAMRERERFER